MAQPPDERRTKQERTARVAAANLSAISLHKVAHLSGALLFAVLVPRSLGPELFGQLAFVLSLAMLLQIPGDLGGLDIFGRHVQGWTGERVDGRQRIAWLVWQLTTLRLLMGLAIMLAITLAAPLLAPWLNSGHGFLIGLASALRLLSLTPFQLCFGHNWMGRWAVDFAWRQPLLIPLLLLLQTWGLDGLLAAIAITEAVFLALGLFWGRDYLRPQGFDWPRLLPYLRYGAGFFLANVAVMFLYRSGPVLLEFLTRDTVAVGYLSLALSMLMLLNELFTHYAASFVPMISRLVSSGLLADARRWLDRLMRYASVFSGLLLIGVFLLADRVIPLALGQQFQPVAPILRLLALTLLVQPLLWAGRVGATAYDDPRARLAGIVAGLIAFWLVSLLLMPGQAAAGAALAFVLAHGVSGLVMWAMGRRWLHPSVAAWARCYAPLLLLVAIPEVRLLEEVELLALLLLAASAGMLYLATALLLGVVTRVEVRQTVAAFRSTLRSAQKAQP